MPKEMNIIYQYKWEKPTQVGLLAFDSSKKAKKYFCKLWSRRSEYLKIFIATRLAGLTDAGLARFAPHCDSLGMTRDWPGRAGLQPCPGPAYSRIQVRPECRTLVGRVWSDPRAYFAVKARLFGERTRWIYWIPVQLDRSKKTHHLIQLHDSMKNNTTTMAKSKSNVKNVTKHPKLYICINRSIFLIPTWF